MNTSIKKTPEVTKLLEQGYGPEIAASLLDALEKYAIALESLKIQFGVKESNTIINLTWLFRALIKDCANIDIDKAETWP